MNMLKRTSDIYPAEDVLRFLIQALRVVISYTFPELDVFIASQQKA